MKHVHWTFILTEKHLLRPPLYITSKTMSESQDIQMRYANDIPKNHTKSSRPIITDRTRDEFNMLCV